MLFRLQFDERGIAVLRGLLEVRARLCAQRFRQCAEADGDVADDAGIKPVVEGETFGRSFDLQQGHAVGNVATRRKPDVLKEGAADEQHEVGIAERLAHLPGVAGERLAVARMGSREGRVMPQPFEPTVAPSFRQRHQRLFAARSCHVVAGDDGRLLRLQKQRGQRFHAGRIGAR